MEKQPNLDSKITKRVENDEDYSGYVDSITDLIFTVGTLEAVLDAYSKNEAFTPAKNVFEIQELLPTKKGEIYNRVDQAIDRIKTIAIEEIDLLPSED
ncbi:MAG: hypothetical protein WCK80_01210 [bacterium]